MGNRLMQKLLFVGPDTLRRCKEALRDNQPLPDYRCYLIPGLGRRRRRHQQQHAYQQRNSSSFQSNMHPQGHHASLSSRSSHSSFPVSFKVPVGVTWGDGTVTPFYFPDYLTPWDEAARAEFLGNFYQKPLVVRDRTYYTAEAAFQAFKWLRNAESSTWHVVRELENARTGSEAFNIKKKYENYQWTPTDMSYNIDFYADDPNLNRITAMREVLMAKFSDDALRQLLQQTGNSLLLEHNVKQGLDGYWSDNKDGEGLNFLGLLLMEIRDGTKYYPLSDMPFWQWNVRNAAKFVNENLSSTQDVSSYRQRSCQNQIAFFPVCIAGNLCRFRKLELRVHPGQKLLFGIPRVVEKCVINNYCTHECYEWHMKHGIDASPCQAMTTCIQSKRDGPGPAFREEDNKFAFCSQVCKTTWIKGPACSGAATCLNPVFWQGELRPNRSLNPHGRGYCSMSCKSYHEPIQ